MASLTGVLNRRRWAAVVGILVCVLFAVVALRIQDLASLGSSAHTFHAYFDDAGGLGAGDPVEISGMKQGKVSDLKIAGKRVEVTFSVNSDISLGSQTTAQVSMANLLGAKQLSLKPQGSGTLRSGSTIPRTVDSYDVMDAFDDLTDSIKKTDTQSLAKSLSTLSDTFSGAAPVIQPTLRGVERLSTTLASRDAELQRLMRGASTASSVLDARKFDVVRLLGATSEFAQELNKRQSAIDALLVNTRRLAVQLNGLVADDGGQLTPALKQLAGVTTMLAKHQADLRSYLSQARLFGRYLENTSGSGPWFDNFIAGLPDDIQVTTGGR